MSWRVPEAAAEVSPATVAHRIRTAVSAEFPHNPSRPDPCVESAHKVKRSAPRVPACHDHRRRAYTSNTIRPQQRRILRPDRWVPEVPGIGNKHPSAPRRRARSADGAVHRSDSTPRSCRTVVDPRNRRRQVGRSSHALSLDHGSRKQHHCPTRHLASNGGSDGGDYGYSGNLPYLS